MVQMIATDMDGTLLNHEGKISPENQKALRLAREKGILVVIATGRSYQGAVTVLEEAGLRLPLIHLNRRLHPVGKRDDSPGDFSGCKSSPEAA